MIAAVPSDAGGTLGESPEREVSVMDILEKRPGDSIFIGVMGESKRKKVIFDVSDWDVRFGGEGRVELIYSRPVDRAIYPIDLEREGSTVVWTITADDTAKAGTGRGELRYYIGDTLVQVAASEITVDPSLLGVPNEIPNPPGPVWLGRVTDVVSRAEKVTERAESGGLSAAASGLLISILRNGIYSTDQSANITALETVLVSGGSEEVPDGPVTPVVALSSISATYSSGDVAVGTAMADLTGIVVTAHYSDGSTKTVTDYTLSGEIAEGKNTITVTYQGKTATFTVNGIAEPTGENNGWVNGQAYELNKVDCLKLDTTTGETLEAESGTMVTDFLPCLGVSAVSYEAFDAASILNCVLYDEEKNFIKANGLLQATDPTSGNIYTYLPLYHVIPEGTAYIRFTQRSSIKHLTSVTPHKYPVLGETTECETGRWYESGAVLGSLSADKGTLTVDDTQTWYVTGYCMVYGASKVHFSQSTRKIVVFYDGNKNYISGTTVNNTTAFEIPENAVYMAASSGDMNNLHIWLEA